MKKIIFILLTCLIAFSMTGCKKKEKEVVDDAPVVVTPERITVDLGDIVRLRDTDVPLLVVGSNFIEKTTGVTAEYIGVFYPTGITGDNNYVGFEYKDVEEEIPHDIVMLRSNLNYEGTFEDMKDYRKFTSQPDSKILQELNRQSAIYSVYTKNTTDSGISIGVKNIEYTSKGDKDIFVFVLDIDNKSNNEIIANGRLDITLTDGTTKYECDDSLINAKDIINFKIPAKTSKTGKIAFEVRAGVGSNLVLSYESKDIPKIDWYVAEINAVEEKIQQ